MDAWEHALAPGREHLEAGRYFEAHEAFEDVLRKTRGQKRQIAQVLVWWAAALHHLGAGDGPAASKLIARAWRRVAETEEPSLARFSDALLDSWTAVKQGTTKPPRWPAGATPSAEGCALEVQAQCPSCGESVMVSVAPEDAYASSYVEDCPVCCRSWTVDVSGGEQLEVMLSRA